MGKTKRVREEMRRKGVEKRKREEKSKKREDGGSKESSRRMGDLEWRRRSSKVRRGGKETGSTPVP